MKFRFRFEILRISISVKVFEKISISVQNFENLDLDKYFKKQSISL